MLRLRPYKKRDAEQIVTWFKDERSFRQWAAYRYSTYPISEKDMNTHYEEMEENDDFFEMTAFDETGIVGHFILRFTDEKKEVIRLGFIIINGEKRGKGYGKEMLQLAVKYAFDFLKVKQVTLGVFENNSAAFSCYKAVGFKEVKRESCCMLGETWECIEMVYKQ